MKKRKNKKIIIYSALAVSFLSLGVAGLTTSLLKNNKIDDNIEVIKTNGIKISSLGNTVLNDDNTVTKQIIAIVLDNDAPDKSVDWEISWTDDAALKEEDISDYLVLTTESDGSTTANITCKKSFRGSTVTLKVTTRVGGYEAICLISYEGLPSTLTLDCTNLSKGTDSEDFMYYLPVNETTLDLNLNNVFNDVGEDYYNQVSVTSEGIGSINVATYNITRTYSGWGGNDETLTLNSIKDSIFSVSYSNKKLTIKVNKKVESYYGSLTGNSYAASYNKKFRSYVSGSAGSEGIDPYWRINLKCNDAVSTFNFRVVSSITSVSIPNSLTF